MIDSCKQRDKVFLLSEFFHFSSSSLARLPPCLAFISHSVVFFHLSMLSSLSRFNAFFCERHLFYNFLSLSYSIFLPLSPPSLLHLFHQPSSHILSCQGHRLLKEEKKMYEYYESPFHFCLLVPFFPPAPSLSTSVLQRYLMADFPHACQNWTTPGRLTKYKRMNKK